MAPKPIGKKRAKVEPAIVDAASKRVSPIMLDIDAAMSLIKGNEELFTSISLAPLGPGEGGSAPSICAGRLHQRIEHWN